MTDTDVEILEGIINEYKNGVWRELPYKFNKEIIQAIENLIEENKEYKRQLDLRYDEFINRDRWE